MNDMINHPSRYETQGIECGTNTNYDFLYCPHCGAKMAGGDANDTEI